MIKLAINCDFGHQILTPLTRKPKKLSRNDEHSAARWIERIIENKSGAPVGIITASQITIGWQAGMSCAIVPANGQYRGSWI